MPKKKTYRFAAGEGKVRFSLDRVEAIYPIREDNCCPRGFSVVLDNGCTYRLHPDHYEEISKTLPL